MSEIPRLLDLFHRTFEGDAWHGDPVTKILQNITAPQAARLVLPNIHTIWELVLHMAVWKDVARWRIKHNDRQPTPDENFPAVTDPSPAAWEQAKERLAQAHRALCNSVAKMSEEQLFEEFPAGGGLSHYVRLHGVIQHDCYHSAQIAILKKAQA